MTELLDRVSQCEMTHDKITYLVETVTEDGLAFDKKEDSAKRVACLLPVSDQMLGDQPAVISYINSRMPTYMKRGEEQYVIDTIRSASPAQRARRLRRTSSEVQRAVNEVAKAGMLYPDAVVARPGLAQRLEGKLREVDAITSVSPRLGEVVVGNFGGAITLWRKGDLTTKASNSYQDFFWQGLTAIIAEQEELATVYRPSAFLILQTRTWPTRLVARLRRAAQSVRHPLRGRYYSLSENVAMIEDAKESTGDAA